MAPILAARTVTKSFAAGRGAPMVAVQDLSLDVDEGELVCLLGASGCGKSTILNMFAGFVAPDSGELLLRGDPIRGIEPRCGVVFQSYALFPWKTVRGNVAFGPRMQGLSSRGMPPSHRALHSHGESGGFRGSLSGGTVRWDAAARDLGAVSGSRPRGAADG